MTAQGVFQKKLLVETHEDINQILNYKLVLLSNLHFEKKLHFKIPEVVAITIFLPLFRVEYMVEQYYSMLPCPLVAMSSTRRSKRAIQPWIEQ